MRYLILFFFSCTLSFSCGTEATPVHVPAKIKSVKTKKVRKPVPEAVRKARAKKAKAIQARYWAYMRKNVGLNDSQINQIKALTQKYAPQIKTLKKAKKWTGKKNAANRKKVQNKKRTDIKNLLGSKWPEWLKANSKWTKKIKKKK